MLTYHGDTVSLGYKEVYKKQPLTCECGNEKDICALNFLYGKTKSCGCVLKKMLIERNKKPITDEQRETLRKTHLGQRAWNKGVTGKDSHCYGRKLTSKQRQQISERVSGSKSIFWKGGISPLNERIRKSGAYQEWRKSVFERDDYTCQECKQRGGELHADHIKQFAYFPELRFVLSNGRTLCVNCHRQTETYGRNLLIKNN